MFVDNSDKIKEGNKLMRAFLEAHLGTKKEPLKMKQRTEINFKLIITEADTIRVIEEFRPNVIEFRAPALLKSSYVEGMVAEGLTARFKEIVSEHLKG